MNINGTNCGSIVAILSSAVAHDPSRHAVWAAAYLVLVVGVIQFALGAGQALLAMGRPSPLFLTAQCGVLNIGNACVIAGTLLGLGFIVDIGGALLVVALISFFYAVGDASSGWLRSIYRLLLVFVVVSIVIGLGLSAANR